MPIGRMILVAGLLAVVLGAATPARSGVPRACLMRTYQPLECASETRRQSQAVLPPARLRELERQRAELAEVAPAEDRERNRLLERIADEDRCRSC